MFTKLRIQLTALLIILSGLSLVSCSNASQEIGIQVENIWGRPSPMSATVGVFYLQVINTAKTADKLLSAESKACGVIEIHETIMQGDTMGMRPVEAGFVPIPAGETVEFKSGGLHLMCIDKLDDFTPGKVIPLTLNFEVAGTLDVNAEVRNP